MKPLNHDPCSIHLRWYGATVPEVGQWLISKKTAYRILSLRVVESVRNGYVGNDYMKLRVAAIRFTIPDVPADAVRHSFVWDSRGRKR